MVDDGRTTDDGRRTDDGRTPDHGHPISSPCEPDGSGELTRAVSTIIKYVLLISVIASCNICVLPGYMSFVTVLNGTLI